MTYFTSPSCANFIEPSLGASLRVSALSLDSELIRGETGTLTHSKGGELLLVISKEGRRNLLLPGSNNAFLLCVILTLTMLTDASSDTNCGTETLNVSELDGFTI